jgi:predicted ATP-grasp superfamily ATP-dependent carboligase
MVDVLVTGCDQLTPLSVIRSLGRKGVSVLAAGAHPKSIGFYSRYATDTWVYPSHFEDKFRFIQSILEAIETYQIRLVFPASESTLVVLDEFRSDIERKARFAAPSSEAIELAIDKLKTYEVADKIGIPVPKTVQAHSVAEALQLSAKIGYPLIIKKRGIKLYKKVMTNLDLKVAYIPSEEALLDMLKHSVNADDFPIIQEYRGGIGICVSAIMDDGVPLCLFQYQRTRETPITGGVSTFRESMPLNPTLRAYTIALLRAMHYRGVAMVEFKYDPVRDTFTLMEVNPRVQTSTALALHAGADIPYIIYQLFGHDRRISMSSYKVGVKCRNLRLDLEAVEDYLRGDTHRAFLQHEHWRLPPKWKILIDFLRDFRPSVKGDVRALRDPVPGLVEGFDLLSLYTGRLKRKILAMGSVR